MWYGWGAVCAALILLASPKASAAIQGESGRAEVADIIAMQRAPIHVQFRVDSVEDDGSESFQRPCVISGTITAAFRGDLKAGDRIVLHHQCLDRLQSRPIGPLLQGFDLISLNAPHRYVEAYLKPEGAGFAIASNATWILDAPSARPQHPTRDPQALTSGQIFGLFTFGATVVGERDGKIWRESYSPWDFIRSWAVKDGKLCTVADGGAEACRVLELSNGVFSLVGADGTPMPVSIGPYGGQQRPIASQHVSGTVLRDLDGGFILTPPDQPGITFVTAAPPLPAPGAKVDVLGRLEDGVWVASKVSGLK